MESLKNIPALPGVYLMTHLKTGHFYIGSSGTVDARLRYHKSKLKSGKHPNQKLSAIFSIWEDFQIEVFIYPTLEEAKQKEQELLNAHHGNLLNCNIGNGSNGAWLKGTMPEHLLEILRANGYASKGHKSRLGIPHTASSRSKISATKSTKVSVNGQVYENARAVAAAFDIPYQTVITRINAKSKKFAGWFYLTDP